MRIANVMFGRGLGGIEQAFLDYNDALLHAGYDVLAVTHPLAAITANMTGKLEHHSVVNFGNWDFIAAYKLAAIYDKWQADVVISHGNRAINLNYQAKARFTSKPIFHIGVTHNYQLKHFCKLDGIWAITSDLQQKVRETAPMVDKLAYIPNMINMPQQLPLRINDTPVIGAMGRLIAKKGMHFLLQAAQILANRNLKFKLVIGGEGPELGYLKSLAAELQIADRVNFVGWVSDKQQFFADIDIFCLPSVHEPFGIVLLEAMAYGRPVVTFATEGPTDIIQNAEAILVANADSVALADALDSIISDTDKQKQLVQAARKLVETRYAMPAVSRKMADILQQWCNETKCTT